MGTCDQSALHLMVVIATGGDLDLKTQTLFATFAGICLSSLRMCQSSDAVTLHGTLDVYSRLHVLACLHSWL